MLSSLVRIPFAFYYPSFESCDVTTGYYAKSSCEKVAGTCHCSYNVKGPGQLRATCSNIQNLEWTAILAFIRRLFLSAAINSITIAGICMSLKCVVRRLSSSLMCNSSRSLFHVSFRRGGGRDLLHYSQDVEYFVVSALLSPQTMAGRRE